MFREQVLLLLHVMCLHNVRATCSGVAACPWDQPYCSTSGCVSTCGDLFIDPMLQCVKFCLDDVYKELIDTIETDSGDEIQQKRCVTECPEHKPYTSGDKCVDKCPPDKPYKGFASLEHFPGKFFPVCGDMCQYFVVNMECGLCPDETKYIDDNKQCLNTSDCPADTIVRDDVTYKKYGLIQCLSTCGDYMVFWNGQCTYSWHPCEHPWFDYDGQCISECPVDFVAINRASFKYTFDFTCAQTWVLRMVGGILLLPTLLLIIFWRDDFYGLFILYLIIWKIKVMGIDIFVKKRSTEDDQKLQSADEIIELEDICNGIRTDEHFDGYDNQISDV